MDFETALVQELIAIPQFSGRVYPLNSPKANAKQGVPYLIYQSSEGLRDKALDGYMDSKSVPVELNIVAARHEEMKSITNKVIKQIIGMEGRQIGTGGPTIEEVTYQPEPVELYESQPGLYRCVVEATFYFEEA